MTEPKLLYSGADGLRLFVAPGTDNRIYPDVLSVRRDGEDRDHPSEFPFDEASDHYVAYKNRKPFGCLTATRAASGRLDCEEFYGPLVDKFRSITASGCKLKIINNSLGRPAMLILIRHAWADQLAKNIRLDVINATGRLIRIYRWLGYQPSGIRFEHPVLKTDSEVLYLAADPTLKGRLADVFQGISNPLFDTDVQRVLNGS